MKKITSQEIKALKIIIKNQTERIIMLQAENEDLRKSLYEARANEGRGVLERAVDTIITGINKFTETLPTMPTDKLIKILTSEDAEDQEP